MSEFASPVDGRAETLPLRRIGHELALIYHDTLQAPLPASFQALIDRLSDACSQGEGQSERRRA